MLISFIGIDGSGKSTLTRAIVDELNKKGLKFNVIYAGFRRSLIIKPLLSVGRYLFARNVSRGKKYSDFSRKKRDNLSKHKYLFKVYELLVMLEYLPQVLIKTKFMVSRGVNLISDRYVFDTAINTGFNFNYTGKEIAGIVRRYFKFLPEPDLVFLIDLPEEIAFQRKDDVFAVEYLKERRELYRQIADIFEITILDGTKLTSELRNEAIDIICQKLAV